MSITLNTTETGIFQKAEILIELAIISASQLSDSSGLPGAFKRDLVKMLVPVIVDTFLRLRD